MVGDRPAEGYERNYFTKQKWAVC